ncbi:MAG: L,D-transpeptidase [Ktedonobacteraceae bacterium]
MIRRTIPRSRYKKSKGGLILLSIALLLAFLLSACGADPQVQQSSSSSKAQLDAAISSAENIGVPASLLQPILNQEKQLNNTSAPWAFLGGQGSNVYYANLSQRYHMLTVQVQGLKVQATQQLDYQAAQDIQSLENALGLRQSQNFIEVKTYQQQLEQYQNALARAQYPKDYLSISLNAKQSTLALNLMEPAYNDLTAFQQDVKQLKDSRVDTTAFNQEEQQDLQLFRNASTPADYTNLINQLQTQIQTTSTVSIQAIPYVSAAKLQQFSADIAQLKQYGQSTTSFEAKYQADQAAFSQAKTISQYLKVSSQIEHDTASLQYSMTVGYTNYLYQQYENEVNNWGNSHAFHDPVDGNSYPLDYEYSAAYGVGLDGNAALQYAQSTGQLSDYQAALTIIQNNYMELKAMEADYADKTPYNQPHATDISLMKHYGVYGPNSGAVLVVSFVEQALRYYLNGKLIRSFWIVSGQYQKPSPPGFWSIILKESPTVFKSSEPPGSAFWYPNTNIQYAMEYHSDGYFFHDAWWRQTFGTNDEFPHYDAGGTTYFNGDGSHGCINMVPSDVAWLYPQIPYGASVILY